MAENFSLKTLTHEVHRSLTFDFSDRLRHVSSFEDDDGIAVLVELDKRYDISFRLAIKDVELMFSDQREAYEDDYEDED